MDRKCLAAERPEHVTTTIPESQRQKTAAVLFQDVALFHTPWAFNVSEIRPEIRRATHIWQASACITHNAMVCICIAWRVCFPVDSASQLLVLCAK